MSSEWKLSLAEKGYEFAHVVSVKGEKSSAVKIGAIILKIDPKFYRPAAEVETLLGDPSLAKNLDGSLEISAQELCLEMIEEDLKRANRILKSDKS